MSILELQLAGSTDACYVQATNPSNVWSRNLTLDELTIGVPPGGGVWKAGMGLRFLNVTIPQGVTISAAYLIVTAYVNDSNMGVNSVIAGDDEDNAATFSSLADYKDRCGTVVGGANNDKRTTASVPWNNIEAFTQDTEYQSPDISSVIQEIINRAGWASGNALALFWEDHAGNTTGDHRRVYSYIGSPTKAVKLHIEFEYAEDYYTPAVVDNIDLADAPSYNLEMAQSIIDEFLSLMDSQALIWTFSDHSAFEDEIIESLVVAESQTYGFATAPSISESLDLVDSQDLKWLKSILETFDLSDGVTVGWLTELIETILIYDELRHGWKVTAESSLILTDTIETLLGIIIDEWINFIDVQSNNWNGREIISESVTLYDIAGFAKIYADSLSDEINIADVSTYQLTITVLEYLGFTELANAMKTSAAAINDSLDMVDNPALAFPQSVESILNVVDLSTVAVQFLHAVQSDLGLADVSSLIKRISDTLTDPIVFVDTITSHAHLYSLIYDTLHLDVLVDLEGEFYECYVLNTPKFMPSMYSGFNFNSYCVFENRAFGANDTGIYELTGETDAGNAIHTGIILSKTNFNSPNQKRFRRGYLDISGTSPKMILETEDGQRQAYAIDEQGKAVASHELKSKSWKLSVAEFETLGSIKLIPVILTK